MNIQRTQWEPIHDLDLVVVDLCMGDQPQFGIGIIWNDTFWKPCFVIHLYTIRIQVGWLVG